MAAVLRDLTPHPTGGEGSRTEANAVLESVEAQSGSVGTGGGPPIHIVHVVHALSIGGLENGVVNLINGCDPGLRHSVICLSAGGPLQARLPAEVQVFVLGKKPGQDFRMMASLVRLLRRLRPDVVHSRNWGTFDAVPIARVAGVPVVIHGEHGREATDPQGRIWRRNFFRRALSPFVDRFVAVTDELRDWLVTDVGVRATKVSLLYNGVDTNRFAPCGTEEARGMVGWRQDELVIGTVGRLDPVKDQALLVRAFDRVQRDYPHARLVIAGSGPCRSDLEALVQQLDLRDRVDLLGDRDDVESFLPALDIFVLPSMAEGMSNTILEAMACGLPIVASRVGGTPEMVSSENGLLFPAGDCPALTAALSKYLENPGLRRSHGLASRERAVVHFSLEIMRSSYAELYLRAMGREENQDRG